MRSPKHGVTLARVRSPARRLPASVSAATKWSIAAGLSRFGCAVAVAFLLSDLLTLFEEVIGLPAGYGLIVLASPALLIGAAAWWAVVERRTAHTYWRGALAGLQLQYPRRRLDGPPR